MKFTLKNLFSDEAMQGNESCEVEEGLKVKNIYEEFGDSINPE